MGHDGEGDRPIDVVEPAGSDTFAVNKLGGKQVASRLRPHFPRPDARLTFNLARRSTSICRASRIA
jgi:multiple sugar transport system ATP-binding protein